jgi:hypothetical protein
LRANPPAETPPGHHQGSEKGRASPSRRTPAHRTRQFVTTSSSGSTSSPTPTTYARQVRPFSDSVAHSTQRSIAADSSARVAVVHGASLVRDDLEVALSRRRKNRRSRRAPKVILAGMIKTSRVVGVILLGLLIALFLPALDVNSTLSVFIAFAVMLVVVSVLAARAEGRRSRGAIARDEARTSGEGRQ